MLEQKNQGRARFKFAVICVIGVHIAGLMALLLTQGCKRDQPQAAPEVQPDPYAVDTNAVPFADNTNFAGYVDTNAYVAPTNLPPVDTFPHTPPPSVTEHVIVKGDTFYDLAKKYGVTMQALKDANPNVNPSKLQLNQKIAIPAPTVSPSAPMGGVVQPPSDPGAATTTIHKVASGENLTKIAEKYKVTVNAIRKANNLTSDRIIVGQKLTIPAKSAQ
jgi:LysM repeat protein